MNIFVATAEQRELAGHVIARQMGRTLAKSNVDLDDDAAILIRLSCAGFPEPAIVERVHEAVAIAWAERGDRRD